MNRKNDTNFIQDFINKKIKIYRLMIYKIAIDDFWTGNSNFERLLKIKPNYLKIDWCIIRGLKNNDLNIEIVK